MRDDLLTNAQGFVQAQETRPLWFGKPHHRNLHPKIMTETYTSSLDSTGSGTIEEVAGLRKMRSGQI